MKFSVATKNLRRSLGVVGKIATKNLNLPILNTLLIKTDNKRLKVSSTNLEIGINYWLGALIEEEGEFAVPVKIFTDFIAALDEEKINISTKRNIMHVNSGSYKTQIVGFEPRDFPLIPKIDTRIATINAKILLNAFQSVTDSVSLSGIRPELTGIMCRFERAQIFLASTDSFRLSERIIPVECERGATVIVPRTTVGEAMKLAADTEQDITVYVSDNQIQFSGENFDLVSRLIDGRYPDYQKIIPDKFNSRAIFDKTEFEKNVRLTGLFASNINDIKMTVSSDQSDLVARHSDKGEIVSSIKCKLTNESFGISLNYAYLLDGLKNIPSEQVIVEYTGEGSPLVLKPSDKDIQYTYLIMPLKS